MRVAAESIIVTVGPDELVVSPRQVARYAGGGRYRLDASQRKRVGAALEHVSQLVSPVFVYSLHAATASLSGGDTPLESHTILPTPSCARAPEVQYLAVCVCTLGGKLEQMVRTLMSAGRGIEGLLLDAAGVALLEGVSARALDTLQRHARERRLHCSGRFGPGYGGVDLSFQKWVFTLVDASSIDVRLNECCVMIPGKSLSFFTQWTAVPAPTVGRTKCDSCHLTQCLYRC
jgi:hypothetical protein